jgi:nitroreductase
MNVSEALQTRRSIGNFDASATITGAEISALVDLAQQAPSSFNIQFTRFVVVTDSAVKAELQAAAWNQPKIGDAAAVFVLTGAIKAHEAFAVRTKAAADAGYIPADVAERMVGMANQFYSNAVMAREESVRSVGLSSMALMLAAEERGWVSCPMIGYDPEAVSKILDLDADHPPLMVVVVGKPAAENMPRKPRLPASEVLRVVGAE